ncbi:HAMP domain-containing histidine kinase [Sulfidibacter corallicola]|uniref:histidine kinase n=1 Tax=Sulfidibacter corallicola TaxID=2818388 RepID=A0A8A4TVN7_SULCO|nr:HAMP domain-containing sensor histidine kinase [Sulfidibacter corallicola]QTD53194.1 HAMP domain-containing histidine kinase [Sulfidibacter corallicola]
MRFNRKALARILMIAPPILFVLYITHSISVIRGLLSESSSFHLDYANNLIQDYLEMSLALDLRELESCLERNREGCKRAKWLTVEPEPNSNQTPFTEVAAGEERLAVYLRKEALSRILENYFSTKPGLKGLLTSRYHEPVYWIQILDADKQVVYRSGPDPDKEADHQVYAMDRTLKGYVLDIVYSSFGPKQLYSVARTRINFGLIFLLFVMALSSLLLATRALRQKILLARQKTFFVTTVSHEFKTPLAIMKLAAETLSAKRYKTEEDEQRFHRMITTEINRLDLLVHKILSFNKIEMGQIQFHPQRQDLKDILRPSLEAFQMQAKSEGIQLEVDLTESPCPIEGDPGLIRHAFDNICDNAFKYNGDGKRIDIDCSREAQKILVRVRDFGVGIKPEELPHITKSFYRIDDPKTRGIRGSGLGLSISNHIFSRSGAKLSVASIYGEGTTFTICFPVCEADNPAMDAV